MLLELHIKIFGGILEVEKDPYLAPFWAVGFGALGFRGLGIL